MNQDSISDIPENRKLSDQELLEGKSSHEDSSGEAVDTDPRFKSPDEILLELMTRKGITPKKKVESPPAQVAPQDPPNPFIPLDALDQPINGTTEKSSLQETPSNSMPHHETIVNNLPDHEPSKASGSSDLASLQEQYNHDRILWKEYEQNILHWKEQVLQIVKNLKKELAQSHNMKLELESLRKILHQKDEEIDTLKKKKSKRA